MSTIGFGHLRLKRRRFLGLSAALAGTLSCGVWAAAPVSGRRPSKVALLACKTYDVAALKEVYQRGFDLLGGVGRLVKGKTVTIKLNLTGTSNRPVFNRHPGYSYMSHPQTAAALVAVLFREGVRRVRLVESTNSRATLEQTLKFLDWDLQALSALGPVEYENTRNLGLGRDYATLKVAGGGHLFSAFQVNHSYADTDVLVSLCKLKDHLTTGVTLSMKNLFGITPNSLYGDQAGSEEATAGRGRLHGPGLLEAQTEVAKIQLPGMKKGYLAYPRDPGYRVPHTIADLCAARPIDLAIIDGITTMTKAEGYWGGEVGYTEPGVMIMGLDPVATDAVGMAVMGYPNPRAPRGELPFNTCDNHLLLAEQSGLGTADLTKIEVVGRTIQESVHPFPRSPLNKKS
ncbi:MAG: DUF362 domain-containing protein [Verrucomicrobiae bacterium]|nr:DUF362 domain-containing protein [Verrucomicrobiae bacterium]